MGDRWLEYENFDRKMVGIWKIWPESGQNIKKLAKKKYKMRSKMARKHKLRPKNMNHEVKQSESTQIK